MTIIEPCCIDRQLPALLRSNEDTSQYFSSNGDWTLRQLMMAVSYMVPGGVMVLAIPEVDVFLLRVLRTYLVKEWCNGIILLTWKNQEDMVRMELGKHLSSVAYAHDERYALSQFGLTNGSHSLVIIGPMLLEINNNYSTYSGYYGRDNDVFYNAMGGVISRVRTSKQIKNSLNDDLLQVLSTNLDKEDEGI
jgi:hypothetical protein